MKKLIYDAVTGEESIVDLTDEDLAQKEKDMIENEQRQAKIEQQEAQRQAILDRLGLSADEVKLLLG